LRKLIKVYFIFFIYSQVYSASTDKTIGIFDAETAERIRKLKHHELVVNSISISRVGQELLASGSDDGLVCIWDLRSKFPIAEFSSEWPVTAVEWNGNGTGIFSGGIDNIINVCRLFKII